jgi:hypothetical protein
MWGVRAGRAVVAFLVLASLVAARPADAAPRERVERQEYVLSEPFFPDCWLFAGIVSPPASPLPSNKGGACFRLRVRDLSVTVKISDESGLPVSGTYEFQSGRGAAGAHGSFCETLTRRIPHGAAKLTIFVHGPSDGAFIYGTSSDTCLSHGSAGTGTTGTITARFKLASLSI